MIEILVISLLALFISILTFFSGFGLGTLLTPILLIFFPTEFAITATGIVHLVNNIFKWLLIRKNINWSTVINFGIPAIFAAFIGAYLLFFFKDLNLNYNYSLFDHIIEQDFLKFLISIFLLIFASIELIPQTKNLEFKKKWLPLGGVLSGFFGGLTGIQGALRSAFLIKKNYNRFYSKTSKYLFSYLSAKLSFWNYINKTNIYMLEWHKEIVKQFQKSFGISDYGLLWIFFMEGFIVGGLIIYLIK